MSHDRSMRAKRAREGGRTFAARAGGSGAPLLILLLAGLAAGVAHAEQPAVPPPGSVAPKVVSEAEMKRYLGALDELVKADVAAMKGLGTDPAALRETQAAERFSSEAQSVIARHGFDAESFLGVHWNVIFAYAAIELEGREAELAQARSQQQAAMAQMKSSMTPAQYEQMLKGMSAFESMAAAQDDVPPANKVLVKKHKATLDRIFLQAQ